ncbi:hypothetical protein SFC66_03560 [Terribacillus saccharophilus]|uniref:hypothetical protein n=1 Tax=Terribacillus saccharophilus TaxID=361277 RepID=UPI003981BC80
MPKNDSTERQDSFLGRRRVTGQYITPVYYGRDGGRGGSRGGRGGRDEDDFDVNPEVGGTIWGDFPGASFLSPRTPILPY